MKVDVDVLHKERGRGAQKVRTVEGELLDQEWAALTLRVAAGELDTAAVTVKYGERLRRLRCAIERGRGADRKSVV